MSLVMVSEFLTFLYDSFGTLLCVQSPWARLDFISMTKIASVVV